MAKDGMGGKRAAKAAKAKVATAKVESANKNYTAKQLSAMSNKELDAYARAVVTEYYKSGKSGISFGGRNIDDVVDKLMTGQPRGKLLKDVKSIQKSLK